MSDALLKIQLMLGVTMSYITFWGETLQHVNSNIKEENLCEQVYNSLQLNYYGLISSC